MGNCRSKRHQECKNEQNDINNSNRIHINGTDIRYTHPREEDMNSEHINPKIVTTAQYSEVRLPRVETFAASSKQTQVSKDIGFTRVEVKSLLKQIDLFQGTNEDDKNYRYLDEMLTRCILKLDTVECVSAEDKTERKQTIDHINQALSILERRMEVNCEIMDLACNLSKR